MSEIAITGKFFHSNYSINHAWDGSFWALWLLNIIQYRKTGKIYGRGKRSSSNRLRSWNSLSWMVNGFGFRVSGFERESLRVLRLKKN